MFPVIIYSLITSYS